jgi:N-methylhydantoinase A
MMGLRVGIDIGGTFTDLVFLDDRGHVTTSKVLSTPDDYSRGIMDGISSGAGLHATAVRQLMHGTTVATNAILEGKVIERPRGTLPEQVPDRGRQG